jgi:hypothetical protein
MRRSEGVPTARELLEKGQFNSEGMLEIESRGVCAMVVTIVLLTEPTRLVVRGDAGVNGFLKWHIADLIGVMPIRWMRDDTGYAVKNIKRIIGACTEYAFLGRHYRQIYAGATTGAVLHLRHKPSDGLTAIHETLGRRVRESPLRLMYPEPRKKGMVDESLVRQCLLLPYEERGKLVRAVWQRSSVGGCLPDTARIVREVCSLSPAHLEELRLMLW